MLLITRVLRRILIGWREPLQRVQGRGTSLVRTLAVDYAPSGIRVNALVPGSTETPLMWETWRQVVRRRCGKCLPRRFLGRLAAPEEPAKAAWWLLNEDSSYVTGSHLICDGGTLAKGSVSV